MTWRFTLIDVPALPPFDQFTTESGDVEWEIDNTPSISLPGPDSSQIQTARGLLSGTYSIDYDIDITETGIAVFNINFTKDAHTVIVATDSSGNLSGPGNFTGTLNFTLSEAAEGMEISFANFHNNTKICTINSLTLSGGNSQEISEPGGWKDHKLTMNRHMEFFSLVETIEAELLFYGDAMTFINQVEAAYGFDAELRFFVELDAEDTGAFEDYFDGILPLHAMEKFRDNRATITPLQSTLWTKLLNRLESPVDVQSTTTLDGNPCDPTPAITVNLPSQTMRGTYHAYVDDIGISYAQFTTGSYYPIDFNDVILFDEFKTRYTVARVEDTDLPIGIFVIEYGGVYTFDIRIIGSHTDPGDLFAHSLKSGTDYIDYYIQFNNGEPIAFSWEDITSGSSARTLFTFSGAYELKANTTIRVYGQANTTSANDLNIFGGTGGSYSGDYNTYCQIIADTTYPDSEAEGFLIHDLLYGVVDRILN